MGPTQSVQAHTDHANGGFLYQFCVPVQTILAKCLM